MESESIIEETEVPVSPLYRPGDVAMATLLGSPIAGAIVIGMNSARLGRPLERWITLALTALGMAILTGVLWNVSYSASGTLALLAIAVMYKLEQALHGKALAQHKRRGGAHPSTWKAAGIGVLCLLSVGILAAAAMVVGQMAWDSLEFPPNDVVYFAGDATEEDARVLAGVLTEYEWFGGPGEEAYIERSEGHATVSLFFAGDFDASGTVGWCRQLGFALADAGMGPPLTIEICDEYGVVRSTIRME